MNQEGLISSSFEGNDIGRFAGGSFFWTDIYIYFNIRGFFCYSNKIFCQIIRKAGFTILP